MWVWTPAWVSLFPGLQNHLGVFLAPLPEPQVQWVCLEGLLVRKFPRESKAEGAGAISLWVPCVPDVTGALSTGSHRKHSVPTWASTMKGNEDEAHTTQLSKPLSRGPSLLGGRSPDRHPSPPREGGHGEQTSHPSRLTSVPRNANAGGLFLPASACGTCLIMYL